MMTTLAAATPSRLHRPMTREYTHEPVLLKEVVEALVWDPSGLYLDGTVGLGGHSEAILASISAQGKLLGMDMDPEALELTGTRLKPHTGNVRLVHANFRDLGQTLEREKFFPLAGALFDLGVSSLQFDKPARGFSLQGEGPLDMRMDPGSPLTAARIVNEWPAEQLALLFKEFGEVPEAVRLARWVVEHREKKPFETTTDLRRLVEAKLPRRGGIHPATQVFMALRIAVNRELENLTRGLESLFPYLRQGGRVAVISFHSLEDRIVKHVFQSYVTHGQARLIASAPLRASSQEVARNPRSRSAKLRVMEKL
ncbi:MAG: 16S rRNA (cytosine(1402)-N(4))-methyltransferase RsmH [Elusimicrobia bacterium]|nr:16S rRNA (cytosine(1402)-N(4))-methyltransferase RsmH [Elusimicrobiota bacterium]